MTDKPMKLAIFDFGSARTKMTIAWERNGTIELQRYKEETGLAGLLTEKGSLAAEAMDLIPQAIDRLLLIATSQGCTHTVGVATEAIRIAHNGPSVLRGAEIRIGPVSIISPAVEGRILFAGLQSELASIEELCVADIGGGSVQVAWGVCASEVISMPTGTFRLEKEFQSQGQEPSVEQMERMCQFIRAKLDEHLKAPVHRENLVFGSTCMRDFIVSLCSATGLDHMLLERDGITMAPASTARHLLDHIACRPYNDVADYFPENPGFMRGADKALANVVLIAGKIEAQSLIPTNESMGTMLARLALWSPRTAQELGIQVTQL